MRKIYGTNDRIHGFVAEKICKFNKNIKNVQIWFLINSNDVFGYPQCKYP